MCGLLEGLAYGRPGHGPAEAWTGQAVAMFGGSPHFLVCSPRTRFWLCLLGLLSLCGWAASHNPSWLRQPRLPPQWPKEQSSVGAGVGPTPRLECGRQNPESISSLKKKKIYTRNDCFINSLYNKQEWDFIVWLQLKCYFVCILYSLKKLVCNNKATSCLLGGRELAGWGWQWATEGGAPSRLCGKILLCLGTGIEFWCWWTDSTKCWRHDGHRSWKIREFFFPSGCNLVESFPFISSAAKQLY